MQSLTNISLKPFNSFQLEEQASSLYIFESEEELIEILQRLEDIHVIILGGGSNILITKRVEHPMLKNEIHFIHIESETEKFVEVKFGAGVNWHDCVTWAVENDYGGIENLALIPGTVGAAPMQNIGAYGVELKDVFVQLEAIHLKTKQKQIFTHKDCQFGYRFSVFKGALKNQFCITNVTLRLSKAHTIKTSYGAIQSELANEGIVQPTIQDVFHTVIAIRNRKLPNPKVLGNAGSFFKNPIIDRGLLENLQHTYPKIPFYEVDQRQVKVPAGWLIEQCAWKGHRRGEIGVYQNHALVLVNFGEGSGAAIWELAQDIRQSIQEKFGIAIDPEVNII